MGDDPSERTYEACVGNVWKLRIFCIYTTWHEISLGRVVFIERTVDEVQEAVNPLDHNPRKSNQKLNVKIKIWKNMWIDDGDTWV